MRALIFLLCLSTAQAAELSPSAKQLKQRFELQIRRAGSTEPLNANARPYVEAKKLLARGEAAGALRALSASKSDLFEDREALLRAEAELALGKKEDARASYLEAISKAQLPSLADAAARGLINAQIQLRDHAGALDTIDVLLDRGATKPPLLFQKSDILRALGRSKEAADVAWRLVLDYPGTRAARDATSILEALNKRGVPIPTTSARLELARARNLVRAGAVGEAQKLLDALEKQREQLGPPLDRVRAELHQKNRDKEAERQVLERLVATGLDPDDGPEILFRLGQLAMSRDDDASAIAHFDDLVVRFPKHKRAREGAYLAGWIPYNRGDYAESTRRMLAFASQFRRAKQRSEALWFAGWAQYLANDHGLSRRAFEQLLEEHPTSELAAHARYWIGRMRQKAGEGDLARQAYREVLRLAPMSYYGFWSAARLTELGETVVFDPPPAPPQPATTKSVVRLLGADRPIGVDRAILLHRNGLPDIALEELSGVESFLRTIKHTEGRTMIADLLTELGAHHQAFRIGAAIAADGADLVTGAPYAWRAWRHAYPKAFAAAVEKAEVDHQIEGDLILSIMRTESHFRPKIKSPVGAYGLMQLMPTTAKRIGQSAPNARGRAARYHDPEHNVWLGAWYLNSMVSRYGGQLAPAIGAYNAGPAAMDRWISNFGGMDLDEFVERVPYRETRRYIRRVLETYFVYKRLSGQSLPALINKVDALPPAEGSASF